LLLIDLRQTSTKQRQSAVAERDPSIRLSVTTKRPDPTTFVQMSAARRAVIRLRDTLYNRKTGRMRTSRFGNNSRHLLRNTRIAAASNNSFSFGYRDTCRWHGVGNQRRLCKDSVRWTMDGKTVIVLLSSPRSRRRNSPFVGNNYCVSHRLPDIRSKSLAGPAEGSQRLPVPHFRGNPSPDSRVRGLPTPFLHRPNTWLGPK